jgi:pimeloyl-ACP methyl ester carboxylesterase
MAADTVMFLPGLLCDDRLWRDQVRAIGADRCRIADLTRDDTVDAMAARVLAAAPERFALAGLSMGGYVAFAIMRAAPERVTRLALFDSSARADAPDQTKRRKLLISLAKAGSFKGVTPRLLPQLVARTRAHDAALGAEIIAMATRVGQEAFFRQQRAIMGRLDSRPGLGAIRVPTLVAVGAQDALTPPELSAEIAAGIAGARLAVIEDAGHLTTMERPEAASTLLREWLAA